MRIQLRDKQLLLTRWLVDQPTFIIQNKPLCFVLFFISWTYMIIFCIWLLCEEKTNSENTLLHQNKVQAFLYLVSSRFLSITLGWYFLLYIVRSVILCGFKLSESRSIFIQVNNADQRNKIFTFDSQFALPIICQPFLEKERQNRSFGEKDFRRKFSISFQFA